MKSCHRIWDEARVQVTRLGSAALKCNIRGRKQTGILTLLPNLFKEILKCSVTNERVSPPSLENCRVCQIKCSSSSLLRLICAVSSRHDLIKRILKHLVPKFSQCMWKKPCWQHDSSPKLKFIPNVYPNSSYVFQRNIKRRRCDE